MVDSTLLLLGLGRDSLIANAGIAGAIAMTLVVLAMLLVSVLPAYSESWAERLGTSETTPSGPDPKEVIPGREEPLAAPGAGGSTAADAAGGDAAEADAEESNTAIPEPETAGEDPDDPDAAQP